MSGALESLLIPTDDSDGAIAGAIVGIALASRLDANAHVLAVVDLPDDRYEFQDETAVSAYESEARTWVDRIASLAREYDPGIEVTTEVRRGTPFQTIREYAHRREIDAIVMGTKGRSGVDRVLLGSVTENVLRTARTPVLAVPPDVDVGAIEEVTFERFLLPTDGSDGAEIATAWAIALAAEMDAMLHAVYSVDTTPFPELREPPAMIDALEEHGRDAIESVQSRGATAGVSVSASIATGRPATVILEYASEHEIECIVMGTHGRTGIGQWFLGSVTENVVRQADVPVFCIPVSASSPYETP